MSKYNLVIACLVTAILFSPPAKATSIQSVDFATLTNLSEFIFSGEVINSEARWNASGNRIYTYVTFQIEEVLKGQFDGNQVELRFAGGVIDDENFVYQGMIYPKVTEQGIYFVEALNKNLVNPLVGWSQGHYKMDNDLIQTNEGKPVLSIQPSLKVRAGELSEGAPAGMRLGTRGQQGMSSDEFKKRIKAAVN